MTWRSIPQSEGMLAFHPDAVAAQHRHHVELMPSDLKALLDRAGPPGAGSPVESWDPPDCGTIDIRIDADGHWHHLGRPIPRPELERLFASILRREPDDRYVLVTPVEKLTISVDDVPFIAVEMHASGHDKDQKLIFRTNVGDVVTAGPEHPLRFVAAHDQGLKPYLKVRGRLEARLSRPLLYQLVDRATEWEGKLGVFSDGAFFVLPDQA